MGGWWFGVGWGCLGRVGVGWEGLFRFSVYFIIVVGVGLGGCVVLGFEVWRGFCISGLIIL